MATNTFADTDFTGAVAVTGAVASTAAITGVNFYAQSAAGANCTNLATTIGSSNAASWVGRHASDAGGGVAGNSTDGQLLGHFGGQGYASADYRSAAYIRMIQDGASSGTCVPGKIGLYTGTAAATPALALVLNADKTAVFSASVTATQFKLSALNTAPANAGATGTLGEVRIDSSYIYVCTATNTWKRAAIATW